MWFFIQTMFYEISLWKNGRILLAKLFRMDDELIFTVWPSPCLIHSVPISRFASVEQFRDCRCRSYQFPTTFIGWNDHLLNVTTLHHKLAQMSWTSGMLSTWHLIFFEKPFRSSIFGLWKHNFYITYGLRFLKTHKINIRRKQGPWWRWENFLKGSNRKNDAWFLNK